MNQKTTYLTTELPTKPGDRAPLRKTEDAPATLLDNLIGSTGYKGPAKSLREMERGIADGARRA